MKREVLIDAIVRQTTVLLAQLATATGSRAPLAHTANQVFLDLVRELKAQGMTNAVIADMFGLALRTYHKRMRRLSESETFRGQSLWTAVLSHLQSSGPQLRSQVLHRFRNDEDVTLRAVLSDMVEGGVLYSSGQGDATVYRALDASESPSLWSQDPERLANLVWVSVYRFGPLDIQEVQKAVPADEKTLREALAKLVEDGRLRLHPTLDQSPAEQQYSCERCYIPVGSAAGWEAAVLDHYQAVVTTIAAKLQEDVSNDAEKEEQLGGSTYRFAVWRGHPRRDEVARLLSELRKRVVELRRQVEEYNANHDAPSEDDYENYVTYMGQTRLLSDKD